MNFTTNRTTRLAGLMFAVLMTLAINAGLLWQFDSVAQKGTLAQGSQGPTLVTLERVDIVAPRS
ncbi:MAG: hypothetical protein PHS32_06805 [Rhodoferax sp.]|uniref:hypothetical protein n=1 Tax=Rhodoferax sp. TaxID=50421 RepID=UPI002622F4C3|nr:hypothetical protein [Rhodoferax sp.]MDD5333438.1 hypothetical protein [Rhodoferax sp.]